MSVALSLTVPSLAQTRSDFVVTQPIASPQGPCDVSVLRSRSHPANKRFYLAPDGEVRKESFQNPYTFDVLTHRASGIEDLAAIITRCSSDPCLSLIRGLPIEANRNVRRTKETFYEHEDGTPWVMLDFDNIAMPDGVEPFSHEAIELLVEKLPHEFSSVSYFYQHSASAGILKADGTLLKGGVNAHLFFWLNQRVPGVELSAYLMRHCMNTGFFRIGENRGGVVDLTCGIDPATIRSHVQPHYIAAPTIEQGVGCMLSAAERQHFIRKAQYEVEVAVPGLDCVQQATMERAERINEYKRQHGYTNHVLLTTVGERTALVRHSVPPNRQPGRIKTGRPFSGARLSSDERYLTLYFADENSPGSWFVDKTRPQLGKRFDGAELPLKELSVGAHEYVRDTLNWFIEIPHSLLNLVNGFLPPIAEFATARVSLILSPTGSGKTTAAIQWIRSEMQQRKLVFYSAPTIALVDQMREDLQAAELHPMHYRSELGTFIWPRSGVIVTTNESLPRLLDLARNDGKPYSLIFDEIHQAMDGFMRGTKQLSNIEKALRTAHKSLLLTGTLTDVQRVALVDVVREALGSVAADSYCCYEFLPFKRNPISVNSLEHFPGDFVELLEQFQAKLESNEPLPRAVFLMDTSRMRVFENLLSQYGLREQALVVSRQENTPEEIEDARTSDKPILISSPLFGLGLNFLHAPEILWCRFDKVQADTSQIIQSVNRANRNLHATASAEVRIYGNQSGGDEFRIPAGDWMKAKVRAAVMQETTLAGVLEEHLHVDRMVYQLLRKAERNSQVALKILVRDDGIQNFAVEPLQREEIDDDAADRKSLYLDAAKNARLAYESQIRQYYSGFSGRNNVADGLLRLERLRTERGDWKAINRRTERDFENETKAILMRICDIADPQEARHVDERKILRLFAEDYPWVSSQYDSHPDRFKAIGQKSEDLVNVIDKLEQLHSGDATFDSLSGSLTRNAGFKRGVLALSNFEVEYHTKLRELERLEADRTRLRSKGGDKERAEVENRASEFLTKFLKSLGVTFEKEKNDRGRMVDDHNRPIVPATWNFAEMRLMLLRQAERLKALPSDQRQPEVKFVPREHLEDPPPMCASVCQTCVFYAKGECVQGIEVDWQSYPSGNYRKSCSKHQRIKPALIVR